MIIKTEALRPQHTWYAQERVLVHTKVWYRRSVVVRVAIKRPGQSWVWEDTNKPAPTLN